MGQDGISASEKDWKEKLVYLVKYIRRLLIWRRKGGWGGDLAE